MVAVWDQWDRNPDPAAATVHAIDCLKRPELDLELFVIYLSGTLNHVVTNDGERIGLLRHWPEATTSDESPLVDKLRPIVEHTFAGFAGGKPPRPVLDTDADALERDLLSICIFQRLNLNYRGITSTRFCHQAQGKVALSFQLTFLK